MPTITLLLTLCFSFLSNSFFFSFLSFLLYLSLSCSVLPLFCAQLIPLLYYLPCWVFTILHRLTTFVLEWVLFLDHPLVCQLSSHHHLLVLAVPHLIPKQRVLFCFPVHRGIPIRIKVGILSYYLSWHAPSYSNSSFPLLGGISSQYDISPQKSLNRNPRIGSPLLPTTRPYPLLPLTYGPLLLYWLGIS